MKKNNESAQILEKQLDKMNFSLGLLNRNLDNQQEFRRLLLEILENKMSNENLDNFKTSDVGKFIESEYNEFQPKLGALLDNYWFFKDVFSSEGASKEDQCGDIFGAEFKIRSSLIIYSLKSLTKKDVEYMKLLGFENVFHFYNNFDFINELNKGFCSNTITMTQKLFREHPLSKEDSAEMSKKSKFIERLSEEKNNIYNVLLEIQNKLLLLLSNSANHVSDIDASRKETASKLLVEIMDLVKVYHETIVYRVLRKKDKMSQLGIDIQEPIVIVKKQQVASSITEKRIMSQVQIESIKNNIKSLSPEDKLKKLINYIENGSFDVTITKRVIDRVLASDFHTVSKLSNTIRHSALSYSVKLILVNHFIKIGQSKDVLSLLEQNKSCMSGEIGIRFANYLGNFVDIDDIEKLLYCVGNNKEFGIIFISNLVKRLKIEELHEFYNKLSPGLLIKSLILNQLITN